MADPSENVTETFVEPAQHISADVRRILFFLLFFAALIVVAAFGLVAEF